MLFFHQHRIRQVAKLPVGRGLAFPFIASRAPCGVFVAGRLLTDLPLAAVQQLVDAIVSKSPHAIASGKQMFYKQLEMGLDAAYQYASEVMACNMMTDDAGEGIDAFIGKRRAEWKGR